MTTNHKLPKDLNESLKNMEDGIIQSLLDSNKRFTLEFNFEGLKFNRIGITIYKILAKNNNVFITFSDQGAAALAQRDFPDIKDKIFTFNSFNQSNNIYNNDSAMISMLPQPYDFDSFEPMTNNYKGTHYSLNPKFEDVNIGIGSVIRERRKKFVKTWKNVYFLQPLNKAALMHIYPNKWMLFKEENQKYSFKKEFENKPDNESIFLNL
ncbi:MAG: DUF1995 family protein [Prochlorococcus marinus CUG1438]|nr:DUF1995 family protein [Prochlorococcus marinus CUG1438]